MLNGRIIKGIGGFYYVATENGIYECRARGIFRKEKITPLVGDHVRIGVLDEAKKKGSLDEILARKTSLIRPKVANVDQAVIVFAAKNPELDMNLLDRFIILAEEQRLEITIVINKTDLDPDKGYLAARDIYQNAGFSVFPVSAKTGEGVEELKARFAGRVSVLAGPSGVGKSSIIMAINPKMRLATGELSAKIERGKHTTRHAELMEAAPGAFIVDSPGFTSLYLTHIPEGDLDKYFREFGPFLGRCRFPGCRHGDEPDCAVKAEVGKSISPERYSRYIGILKEFQEERKNRYD